MGIPHVRPSLTFALAVSMLLGGAWAVAQEEGQIIRIAPGATPNVEAPPAGVPGQGVPQSWIGLLGGPITPELRAHLDIPEDEGVLVREVVPESPAERAGLRQYDVIVRANDEPLVDMRDLVELVGAAGEQQQQISLEVLRKGQRESLWIRPEARPARVARAPPDAEQGGIDGGQGFGFGAGPEGLPEGLLDWFNDRGGRPFEFRQFGPGVVVGRPFAAAEMPDGVSIQIRKENDQPAQVTVRRGEETWEVVGDDPESLEQLPEDLRPFVEQMLRGGGAAGRGAGRILPALPGMGADPQFRQRLEQMERQLEEMQRRMFGEQQPPVDGSGEGESR